MSHADRPASEEAALHAVLPQLPLLVALGEVENVTLAAALVGRPQPTVSRTLRRLAETLGTEIVEPDGRGIRLTTAARAFLPFAHQALDAVREGVDAMDVASQRARATVRIAFQTSLGEQLVPEAIRAVRQEDEQLRFVLSQGARKLCLDAVVAREADLALVSRVATLPAGLRAVPLFDQALVLLVAADHPWATRGSARVRDLVGEPVVTFKPGYGLRGSFDDLCAAAGVMPEVAFEGEDLHTISGLVAAGLGVSVVPRTDVPPPGCAQVRLDDPRAVRDIGAVLPPGSAGAAVEHVLAVLERLTGR